MNMQQAILNEALFRSMTYADYQNAIRSERETKLIGISTGELPVSNLSDFFQLSDSEYGSMWLRSAQHKTENAFKAILLKLGSFENMHGFKTQPKINQISRKNWSIVEAQRVQEFCIQLNIPLRLI